MKTTTRLVDLTLALMVLTVLAFTLGIAGPRAARERAKLIVCISQQGKIGVAYHLYAADHDGIFTLHRASVPYLYRDAYNHLAGLGLLYQAGYVDDLNTLKCPGRPRGQNWPGWLANYSSRPYQHPQGGYYGYQGGWYGNGEMKPLRLHQIRDPSSLGMLVDLLYEYRAPYLFHDRVWATLFVDGRVVQARETDGDLQTQMETYRPAQGPVSTRSAFQIIERYANGYASEEY